MISYIIQLLACLHTNRQPSNIKRLHTNCAVTYYYVQYAISYRTTRWQHEPIKWNTVLGPHRAPLTAIYTHTYILFFLLFFELPALPWVPLGPCFHRSLFTPPPLHARRNHSVTHHPDSSYEGFLTLL